MRGQFVLYDIDFLNVNQPKLDLVWIKQWQLNKTFWIYWALLRLIIAQSEITRTERNARHSKSSKEYFLFAKQRYKSSLLSISIQYFILCPWADVNRFERLVYILLALEPGRPVIDFFLLSDNWNCKIVPLRFQAQTSAAGDSSSNYYNFNPVSICRKDYNLLKCLISHVRMEWMLGPPVLMGDRVAWLGTEEPVLATVRWLGRLPELFPQQMVAGISLVRVCLTGSTRFNDKDLATIQDVKKKQS